MLKYVSFRSPLDTQINFTFFSPSIRMSGKKKKTKKVISTKAKKYSRQMELMLTKYQFQKKNHMVQISQLNILLDTMMMILDYYV